MITAFFAALLETALSCLSDASLSFFGIFKTSLHSDYICLVFNIHYAFVVISERKIPPSFTKKFSDSIEDTAGKVVKIEGRLSGSQPMTVNWYKDGSEIYSSDYYDISFKNNVALLCIKKSQSSDSGAYTCKATNEAGSATCQTTVKISGTVCVACSAYLIV